MHSRAAGCAEESQSCCADARTIGEFHVNEPSTRESDAAMEARQQQQQTLNRQQTLTGLVLLVVILATFFILPRYLTPPYDTMSMGFGSAATLTILLYLNPDSLRSRGGSLVPAICLVVALWLSAVATTALSLFG